jgi:hypothetical protein
MTNDEIVAAINASPVIKALVPDTVALSEALSNGRTKFAPFEAGKGDVLNTLGFEVGNPFCDLIDNAPEFRHVKHLLAEGRLRVDLPLTVASLQALVGMEIASGTTFTQAHADALLNLARVPDPVTEFEVRCAIHNDDGTLRV